MIMVVTNGNEVEINDPNSTNYQANINKQKENEVY